MLRLTDIVSLRPQERVHVFVRKHPSTMWGDLLVAACFILLPFFFLFTLIKQGPLGMGIIILLLVIGLSLAWRSFYVWDANAFIVTTERLVHVQQKGLWNRIVSEALIHSIRDIQWERKGFRDHVMRLGTIRIKTGASSEPDITFMNLSRPEVVVRRVQEAREKLG